MKIFYKEEERENFFDTYYSLTDEEKTILFFNSLSIEYRHDVRFEPPVNEIIGYVGKSKNVEFPLSFDEDGVLKK